MANIGWEVSACSDYYDIINKADELRPSMVILDNDRTGDEAIEAAKVLKQHKKTLDIPVLFISSNSDIDSLAEDAGADFYLRKPIDIKKLEKVVRQINKALKSR